MRVLRREEDRQVGFEAPVDNRLDHIRCIADEVAQRVVSVRATISERERPDGRVADRPVVEMHGTSNASDIAKPLPCLVASSTHHYLAVPQPFLTSYYSGSQMANGIEKPLPTSAYVRSWS